MTVIRMDTEDVRAVAHQIDLAVGDLYLKPGQLKSAASELMGIWEGGGAARFAGRLRRMADKLHAEVISLQRLVKDVRYEIAEWEEVAARLDGVSAPLSVGASSIAGARSSPRARDEAPQNMRDLAARVQGLYQEDPQGTYTPVRVVQIDEAEYLVMIAGTIPGMDSNNWNSAVISGIGLPSDYHTMIEGILLGLPAGAVVHMAGHSQGGNVANNLALDEDVRAHLKVKSVSTFGSSTSAAPAEGVTYNHYAAWGDPVPYLDRQAAISVLAGGPSGLVTDTGAKTVKNLLFDGAHGQDMIPGSINPVEAHSSYANSSALSGEILPFSIDHDHPWNAGEYYVAPRASASLPILDVGLQSWTDGTAETAAHAANGKPN